MDSSAERTERLLRLLVGLVAVLVLMVVGGAVVGAVAYVRLRASMGNVEPETVQAAAEKTQALGEDVTERQKVISAALAARANETEARLKELRQRKDAIGPPKGGPLAKLSQMTELMHVMTDEMGLLTEHLAQTQERLAKGLRPLPTQKEMVGDQAPQPEKKPAAQSRRKPANGPH